MANSPQQDLEDFASGLGAGALPQQGSMLPVQQQGGMPLGASSPTPPQATPPLPPFQRMPLTQLGGQAPSLEDMLAQRLQAIQGYNPKGAKFNQSVQYYNALEEIPKLVGIANIRSQDRQLQEKNLSELAALADKFHKDYTPEVQAQVRPIYQQLIQSRAQLAGQKLPDEAVTQALTSPDVAGAYHSIFNDPIWSPQDRQEALSRLGRTKTSADSEKVLADLRKQKDEQVTGLISSMLPQVTASMGGSPEKPVTVQAILTNPQVKQYLDQSPTINRLFHTYIGDEKNAKGLANIGIDVSGLKRQEQQAQGPTLPAEVSSFLATLKDANGKPMTPAKASPEMIAWANQANAQFQIAKAANQGLEVEKFKRTLPAPPESRDQHVDIQALIATGDIVKPQPGVTVEQLNSGPYRFANPTQQKALMALKPQRTAFADMNAMAERLIQADNWQQAVPQGVRLYAGAVTGADPLAAAYLAATNAATSYLARMVESGVMTDQDVLRWKQAATASFFDTKSSRQYKIALMGDIMDTAQQAVISQVAGVPMKQPKSLNELLNKLDQSTTDTWKNSKAGLQPGEKLIRGPQGIMKLQKGYQIPPGYEEIK